MATACDAEEGASNDAPSFLGGGAFTAGPTRRGVSRGEQTFDFGAMRMSHGSDFLGLGLGSADDLSPAAAFYFCRTRLIVTFDTPATAAI